MRFNIYRYNPDVDAKPYIQDYELKDVEPGKYFFCCLPVYVVGLEASLARAVLMDILNMNVF